eukprot:TRINITY_DN22629_c0_g1_i1.p1 TRINITY_DN22629_c0_g1~~TRINITY_DN22629_c0_g1_i1.p1  ORF type:complete len:363 (-),score=55.38 TRINITY_DN22629_c0_g1_i1:185-1273(-)
MLFAQLILVGLATVIGTDVVYRDSVSDTSIDRNESYYMNSGNVDVVAPSREIPTSSEVPISSTPSISIPYHEPLTTVASVTTVLYRIDSFKRSTHVGQKRYIHPIDGPFTSTRVENSLEWPYNMVGRLFFQKQDLMTGSCSAGLIQKRLIITAAHCIYSSSGFNQNFEFMPGFVNGTAPFGIWKYKKAWITKSWTMNPNVPSPEDFGILSLMDQSVEFSNGTKETISLGTLLGWFGIKTQALVDNHVSSLGYPSNQDQAQEMHQVDSQFRRMRNSYDAEYPNDMTEGISGGPWVSDFGKQTSPLRGCNQIVGVSSYRDEDPTRMYLGSSILNDAFISILQSACEDNGNCFNQSLSSPDQIQS